MRVLSIVLLLCVCHAALAQTLYKQVDKDGNVTYTDKPPPKDQDKDVKKIETDNRRNVIRPLTESVTGEKPKTINDRVKQRLEDEERLRRDLELAKAQLEAAKTALVRGADPADDEWRTIGAGSGKAARVPSDAFHNRIKKLEDAVKQAEANLAIAEVAYRRGVPN